MTAYMGCVLLHTTLLPEPVLRDAACGFIKSAPWGALHTGEHRSDRLPKKT